MNRFFNRIACGIIAVLLVVGVVSCGGSGPKALAKQTYQLEQDILKAGSDMAKVASLAVKTAQVADKVSKLSQADSLIYLQELARLQSGTSSSSSSSSSSSNQTRASNTNTASNSGIKTIAEIAQANGWTLWEDEVTETDMDRIVGYVQRGRTNLKISGECTREQNDNLRDALRKVENKNQLFRLDFSGLTTPIDFMEVNVGSITLPPNLDSAYFGLESPKLLEINFTDSSPGLSTGSMAKFPKIILPPNFKWTYYNPNSGGESWSEIKSMESYIAVVSEGNSTVNLEQFQTVDKKNVTLALPSTLVEMEGKLAFPYGGEAEAIYCYATTPPVHTDSNPGQIFPSSLKTIYVPAASVKAYEDAWFNYNCLNHRLCR